MAKKVISLAFHSHIGDLAYPYVQVSGGQVSCSHSEMESGSLLFLSQEAIGVASVPESRLQSVSCCPQCVLLLK